MFEDALERIRKTTGLRTQVQLAERLGIRQSSISDAKRRDNLPDSWLVSLYECFDLNPTWVKTGQGPVYLTGDPDRVGPEPRVERGERGAAVVRCHGTTSPGARTRRGTPDGPA